MAAEVALCVALVAGCGPTNAEQAHIETPASELFPNFAAEYSPDQREILNRQHDLILEQEPILADTKFDLVGKEGFESCSNFNKDGTHKPNAHLIPRPQSGTEYCPAIDTVRISAGSIGAIAINYGEHNTAQQTGMVLFLEAHELGHAMAQKEGTQADPKVQNGAWVAYTRGSELQADCLAGRFMQRTAPQLIEPTAQSLLRMPPLEEDPSHGGNIARAQSFELGANGDACKHKGNIQNYPDILNNPDFSTP
jgi:hypothetical protein